MPITAQQIAELRERTGSGVMDVKKALEEAGGDEEKAIEILRKSGIAKAAKKGGRETHEGRVHSYVHTNGKIGVLVEVLCETDFVAKNEQFISFCNDIGMHIAATDPLYLNRADVAAEVIEKQRAMFQDEALAEGKPSAVVEKIVDGRIEKYYSEVALLEQEFVKDPDISVEEYIKAFIGKIGENIQVSRFCRFSI
ncbi:MAG: hypothetical protein ACD_76C00164G0005 [uncultured bacterium]|nr:MAG: hypothetical protein ACD_76C00164G0005 [uncultured bacterium]HBD05503.1 translation elongation factor Ts [Candidatus Uhrbacteria bacterium]